MLKFGKKKKKEITIFNKIRSHSAIWSLINKLYIDMTRSHRMISGALGNILKLQ